MLTDFEKVGPCVPGAELREVDGDELRGVIKFKIGTATVSYRLEVRFESLDAGTHTAVLKADGREVRGQGNLTALVTTTLSPVPGGTKVLIAAEVSGSGRLAQFDRDEVAQASGKLVAEFAQNLQSAVHEVPEPVGAEPAVEAEIDEEVAAYKADIDDEVAADVVKAAEEAISDVADSYDATGASVTYLPTDEPEEERESLLKRLTPYLTVAGLLLIARIVLYSLRRRRR